VKYDDSSKRFPVHRDSGLVQLEAEVEVPSIDFSWKSDSAQFVEAQLFGRSGHANGLAREAPFPKNRRPRIATNGYLCRSH